MKQILINKIKFAAATCTILVLAVCMGSPASAATASFSTSGGGNATVSQTVKVTVSVTGSESYNAVTVVVNFTNLTYLSSSAAGGWTPVSGPSASGGQVSFSGAVLGNTFTGTKQVMSLNFRAPSVPGTATVRANGTIALANGSGSQVSGGGNTVTYTVKPAPTAAPTPPPAAGSVQVSSSTHPDQNSWYKEKNATVSWQKESGVTGYSYSISTEAGEVPDDIQDTPESTVTLSDVKEGINYFHIKAKNDVGWGNVTHFAIHIDTVKPEPFTPTFVKDESKVYFSTNDVSGVKEYVVKFDGVPVEQKTSGAAVPSETKTIAVVAIDHAGNEREGVLQMSATQNIPTSELDTLKQYFGAGASNTNATGNITLEQSVLEKYGLLIGILVAGLVFIIFIVSYTILKRKRNIRSR